MAEADKSIDIVIRTKAELEGAEAVEAALERDVAVAKDLENDTNGAGRRNESNAPSGNEVRNEMAKERVAEPSREFPMLPEVREDTRLTAMGERLAAALERNGELMAAMLQRTLEVAEEQHRQLGELERRVEQLGRRVQGSFNK
jgi:hypothetical protein